MPPLQCLNSKSVSPPSTPPFAVNSSFLDFIPTKSKVAARPRIIDQELGVRNDNRIECPIRSHGKSVRKSEAAQGADPDPSPPPQGRAHPRPPALLAYVAQARSEGRGARPDKDEGEGDRKDRRLQPCVCQLDLRQ